MNWGLRSDKRHRRYQLLAAVLLLAIPGLAQQNAKDPTRLACGPAHVTLHAQAAQQKNEASMPSGKALLFIVEAFHKPAFEFFLDPTVQIGVDGNWVGTTRNRSYLALPIDPGEHHLCVEWKSHVQNRLPQLARVQAEAGSKYYFRARIMYPGGLELQRLDPDEGQLLVSHARMTRNHELESHR